MHPCLSTGLPQAGDGEPHPLEMIVERDPGVGETPLRVPEPSLEDIEAAHDWAREETARVEGVRS